MFYCTYSAHWLIPRAGCRSPTGRLVLNWPPWSREVTLSVRCVALISKFIERKFGKSEADLVYSFRFRSVHHLSNDAKCKTRTCRTCLQGERWKVLLSRVFLRVRYMTGINVLSWQTETRLWLTQGFIICRFIRKPASWSSFSFAYLRGNKMSRAGENRGKLTPSVLTWSPLEIARGRGAWLAQLGEHMTLDLRGCEFEAHTGYT